MSSVANSTRQQFSEQVTFPQMRRTPSDLALTFFHYSCYYALTTDNRLIDPQPPAAYSSAYPQGSSVFPNNITSHHCGNINECPTGCRKQLVPFCARANVRTPGQQATVKVQSLVSRLRNSNILVIGKHVKSPSVTIYLPCINKFIKKKKSVPKRSMNSILR